MSSNSKAQALRVLAVASLAAAAAACASAPTKPDLASQPAPLTPTQQFKAEAKPHPDQILLAPHPEGVSAAQAAALGGLVERWRESGGGPIVIQAPEHGGSEAYRAAAGVQAELEALGVQENSIELAGYVGDGSPRAPLIVGFAHYVAEIPACGRNWNSFTTDMGNGPNSNFGCAVTANMAAMVANPADLAQPQPMTAPDADRRETVIGKYRTGGVMSSTKDPQSDTQISDAVQ